MSEHLERAKQFHAEALMHYEDAITQRSNGENVGESVLLGTLAARLAEMEVMLSDRSTVIDNRGFVQFTPTVAPKVQDVKLVVGDIKVMVYDVATDSLLAEWYVRDHGDKQRATQLALQWVHHNKMSIVERREMTPLR